ncbi:DMT family transporter [Lichenifustis flavocetrariae]|uniref:DMT family transporter n=1 Tax=Lichenifustis flavocetrariae TaxID=2949735 RepID=A0AA41YSZ0_9HYPH|nr:DMT family transporter [Lichenifustis flavocetrariae]MCW6506750.1 DMT family transporter [Lichenifustis flavocetrariae]
MAPLSSARLRPEAEEVHAIAQPQARLSLVPLAPKAESTASRSLSKDRTLAGIGALLLSTLLFPIADMISKTLAVTYTGLEVAWMRYAVLVLAVAPIVLRTPSVLRAARPLLQVSRGLASAISTALALVGFMFLPVADSTAIAFCAPLIITGLAAWILKEHVGWQRWVAGGVGFAGILIVVQPGGGTFQAATLFPLLSSVFSALTVITTRLSRTERTETTIVISAFVGFLVLSGAALPGWKTPDLTGLGLGGIMGLLAATAMVLQIVAYRCAPASLLAPFSYAQIPLAIVIGWLVFGTVPSMTMMIGSAIVIGSGSAIALRESVTFARPRRRGWSSVRRDLENLDPAHRATA